MGSDSRRALARGIVVALGVGLLARTIVGPSPREGWLVNRALDATERAPKRAAADELENAARARPEDAGAWIRAGRARVALGDAQAAADLLEVAVALDPASSTARYELAKALSSGWMNADAEAVIGEMLARRPGHADAMYLFAALAAARGDAPVAAERFEAAVAAGASDPERYRDDPRFDPVRADPRFVHVVRDRRFPSAFREEAG